MRMDRRHVSGGNGHVPSIISTGVRITGDIASDGEVHIDGIVEGDVRANSVTVSPCGSVLGAVSGGTVRIEGTVDGQITGQSVSLAATARVKGDIAHDTLALEQGAHFEGHCQPVVEAKVNTEPATAAAGSNTTASMPPSPRSSNPPPPSPQPAGLKSGGQPPLSDRATGRAPDRASDRAA